MTRLKHDREINGPAFVILMVIALAIIGVFAAFMEAYEVPGFSFAHISKLRHIEADQAQKTKSESLRIDSAQ